MNQPKHLGWGLLLRSLLAGAIIGFLGGYIGEYVLRRYGVELPFDQFGSLFGVALGILTAYFSTLIARRKVLEYVRALHDSLGELGELRPGLRQDPNLDRQASALFQHVDFELSELGRDRQRLEQLLEETGEALNSLGISDDSKGMEAYRGAMQDRVQELDRLQEEASELNQWFESTLKPLFRGQWEQFQFEEMDSFDDMVQFQEELDQRLDGSLNDFREWSQVIQPWKEGPSRIRSEIERANELLLDMAELFREFPREDLPESAETLRQETESWDRLARQLEQGVDRLKTISGNVEESLETLRDRARSSAPPKSTWDQVRAGTGQLDDKVERLKQAVDGAWLDKLEQQFTSLKAQADWLATAAEEKKETLKIQQQQVEKINSLYKKWKQALEAETTKNNSKQNTA